MFLLLLLLVCAFQTLLLPKAGSSRGSIYAILYIEKKRRVLFPHLPEVDINVDEDLKEMWHQVQMPKTRE